MNYIKSMQITKNFSLDEFVRSETATKYNIDNTPTQNVINNIVSLCGVLQKIRDRYGKPMHINSGYRCPKLNSKVGGSKTSQHMNGSAADISVGSTKENKELFDLIVKMANDKEIQFRQLIDEYGYKWVHLGINCSENSVKNNQILHLK